MRTVHSEYEFLLNVCGATWAGSKGDRWRERPVGRAGRAHPCNSFGSGADNIARPQQGDMNFRQQSRHAGAFPIKVSIATCEDDRPVLGDSDKCGGDTNLAFKEHFSWRIWSCQLEGAHNLFQK